MPVLGQPLSHFLIVRHHREDAGVGLAFVAAAGAAIQRGFVGIVVRGAAVGAEQDEPREVLRQSHHAQAVSTVSACSSRVKPVRVIRSFCREADARVQIVLPPQDLDEMR